MFSLEIFIFVENRFYYRLMFVDIHTHNTLHQKFPQIVNLSFEEAEKVFSGTINGSFSVGIHPWDAEQFSDKLMLDLEKWSSDSRFVAIGECGLDKNSKVTMEVQLDVFKKQIDLSERIQKPLIIHCVGSFNELFEIKKLLKPKQLWIIHGFRGKPELAKQVLKLNCALSFGEHFNPASVRITPINKLFIETDESHITIDSLYLQIAKIKELDPNRLSAGEVLLNQLL